MQKRRHLVTIAQGTLHEAFRNRYLWLLLSLLLLSAMLVEFVGSIAITDGAAIRALLIGGLTRLLAVVLTALFVVSSLLREFSDRGLQLLLALPLSRAEYLLGKLAGFAALTLLLILVPVCLTVLVFAAPLPTLLWSVSLYCELLIIVAASVVSVFTFSQVPVAVATVLAFYLLARLIGALQLMGHGPMIDPGNWSQQFIQTFIDLLAAFLPDLYRFTRSDWLLPEAADPTVLLPVIIQTLITVVLLSAIGLFDLYRKNL